MVGDPKTLIDLRKIDAAIKAICRNCGRSWLIDREVTIHQRSASRDTLDWHIYARSVHCPHCGAKSVRVLPLPYGHNDRHLRRWRAENVLINLSLTILQRAAHRSSEVTVGTPEVRLALRVLHPFLQNQNLLATFWAAAIDANRVKCGDCHLPLRWMVTKLVERGYGVNVEFR